MPRIKVKAVKTFFKKLSRMMGEHAFLTSCGFILLAVVFGGLAFYKYSILAEKVKPEVTVEPTQFKEETYKAILEIWQTRQEEFEAAETKEYPNPFRAR